MQKYLYGIKLHLSRHLVYRARVFIWFIVDTVPLFVFPFLWLSIIEQGETIAGYSSSDIVTYYVLNIFVGIFTYSHISRIIQVDIVRGLLNSYLLRPISYFFERPLRELSYKILMFFLASPLLLVFYALFSSYITFPTSSLTYIFFLISIVLGYLLSFSLQMLVGLLAFWFGEIRGFSHLNSFLADLVGGRLAPLPFLPAIIQSVAFFLPYKFIIYIPTQIYLEQISVTQILVEYAIALIWFILLWVVITIIWKKGLRTYDGSSI